MLNKNIFLNYRIATQNKGFMRYFISILIVLLLLPNHTTLAQFNFRFKKLTVKDGLSQSAVSSIMQDRFGFLWVGTRDGLNRYDGYNFKQYYHQPNNKYSLPDNTIHKLANDPQKNLWIATSGFISQYDSNNDYFISYPIPQKSAINNAPVVTKQMIWKDSRQLFLATNHGIILFDTQTKLFSIPTRYKRFRSKNVVAIVPGKPNQDEWVACNEGVYQAQPDNKHKWQLRLKKPHHTSVIRTSANVIMASTWQQIFVFDPQNGEFRLAGKVKGRRYISEMKELSGKQVWVSGGNVAIFDIWGKHLHHIVYEPNNPFSLSHDIVKSVYKSEDGIIWLGTNGFGLNKLDLKLSRFGYIGAFPQTKVTLNQPYTQAIYTANDTLLFVASNEGLNVIDLVKKTSKVFYSSDHKESNRFNCLLPRDKQSLWVGSNQGLWIFRNQQFEPVKNPLFYRKTIIYQIKKVSAEILMLATGEGTLLWNHQTDQIQQLSRSPLASSFLQLSQGFLEGSVSGLREFDQNGKLKNHFQANKELPNALQSNYIKCIFQDSRQRVWIGSWGGGLIRYYPKNKAFVSYNEKDGLPNSVVYGILEDNQQQLWLSTNKGLSVFNPQTKKFRNFQETDGLQDSEFNTGSFFKSPYGRMYFGGINGLTYFDPQTALKARKYIPKTVLIGFYADGKKGLRTNQTFGVKNILQKHEVTLDWSIREFSFEVAGLGYSLPGHTRYKYKMAPFKNNWIEMGKRRYISFTNLAPGEYTLHVKAANSEGQWEKKGLQIKVIIKGPIWRKWWFIVLWTSIVIMLAVFLYLNHTNQLKKKAQKLAQIVDSRTKEIQLKNNEIASQNEELQMQAEMLTEKNELLEIIKENLEDTVKERTKNLTRLNEDLLSQNTKLEQFAFITAHNIRGPVARIQGLLQILPEGIQGNIVEYLNVSVNELDSVILDMVTILDVRNGVDQNFEAINVKASLQQVIQSLHDDIIKTSATIDISQFSPLTLNGASPYFQSVFYNLIHNALKYSKEDTPPLIHISNKIENDQVFIVIADNGTGIEMGYAKQKIFGLYQRFHSERPGKGFGLYLVKTQLEAMRASISVESKVGVGTAFTIKFSVDSLIS